MIICFDDCSIIQNEPIKRKINEFYANSINSTGGVLLPISAAAAVLSPFSGSKNKTPDVEIYILRTF